MGIALLICALCRVSGSVKSVDEDARGSLA
jgi:hypothetical protein